VFERFRKRNLVYSSHAKDQMKRRRITEDDVEEALTTADTTYPGTDKKRENVVKVGTCPNGMRLCVVVKQDRQHIIVTAYWS
jgi:hypothetical protein